MENGALQRFSYCPAQWVVPRIGQSACFNDRAQEGKLGNHVESQEKDRAKQLESKRSVDSVDTVLTRQ